MEDSPFLRSTPHLDALDGLSLAAVCGRDDGLVVVDGPAAADVVAELDQNLEGDRVRLHHLPADDPLVVGITNPAAPDWDGCDREKGKQEGEANHAEKHPRQRAGLPRNIHLISTLKDNMTFEIILEFCVLTQLHNLNLNSIFRYISLHLPFLFPSYWFADSQFGCQIQTAHHVVSIDKSNHNGCSKGRRSFIHSHSFESLRRGEDREEPV